MAAERNEWVYDQLLGFLGGPLFQLPVITYMENKCIIFEPGTEDSQEYRQVHKEYKRLLEALLEGFMKDTDLTHDLLLKALGDLNTEEDLRDIFQSIFEQILAMDDFKIFVHLMSQKNIELQQQALMLIAQRFGGIPNLFQAAGDPSANPTQANNPASEEEAVLKAVLEQSKREYEEMKRSSDAEQEQLDRILATSRLEVTKLEQDRVQEQQKINQAIGKLSLEPNSGSAKSSPSHKIPPSFSKPPFAAMPVPSGRKISLDQPTNTRTAPQASSAASLAKSPAAPSVKASPGLSGSEAAANWLQSAMSDSDTSSAAVSKAANAMGNLTPKQIKERQDYLRQQRDKLLEMKKRERAKQLQNAETDVRERPTSARVAHKAMAGQPVDGPNVEDERKLAMRKAIAERLKAEVIGNK